jgi:hypothetical protein
MDGLAMAEGAQISGPFVRGVTDHFKSEAEFSLQQLRIYTLLTQGFRALL